MKARARELIAHGDKLFAQRRPLETLWQTLAENFHVMRADFTRQRYMSDEFASFLMTGRPALAHRTLSNSIPALMRPRDRQWVWARTHDERINNERESRGYLDWMSREMYRAMYRAPSGFVRSCKEADGDYSAFGNAVMSLEPNQMRDGLLQRTWHLRDVVWTHDHALKTNQVHHRREDLSVRDVVKLYPETAHESLKTTKMKEDPDAKVRCRRIVLPADEYDLEIKNRARFPFVLIDIDIENDCILAEVPSRTLKYIIPGWARVSGSQYAYSLSTIYALPDARMLQQITLTMLEAGQKATDPPMIAVTEAIAGGVNSGAGMITWTDADYDERTGEVLRPMDMRFDGIRYGADREDRITGTIDATFFLNELRMPQVTKEMTAYEASKLYEEFARNSMPLLEPIEVEYNGGMCSAWFDEMQQLGLLGSPFDLPQSLRGQEFRWEFDTPMKAASEQQKVFTFQTVTDIAVKGAQVDPSTVMNVDWNKASREAFTGAGGADWLLPEEQVKQMRDRKAQADQAAQTANAMAHGADVATQMSTAVESAANAGQALQGLQ